MIAVVSALAALAAISVNPPAATTRSPSPLEARAIYCLAALTAERQDLDATLADKLEEQTRRVLEQSRTDVAQLQQKFSAFLTPLSGALEPSSVLQVARAGAGDEAGTAQGNAAVSRCDQTKPEFQACLAAGLGPVLGRLRECHDPVWLPATPLAGVTP
jgi:hypothetical protein